MLDHNIFTTTQRIANEAPIPVYIGYKHGHSLGGCGNVLKNLSSLGCGKLYIFSVVGNDSAGTNIISEVNRLGIQNHIFVRDEFTTTLKQRFFCDNKIVFRCDEEANPCLEQVSFADQIENILKTEKIDCIVLSDYNKGVLYKEHCQAIISIANKYNVFTCVDPKSDYTKYIGCSIIKPNRKEAYDIFKVNPNTPIEDLHSKIFNTIGCKYSVITLAEKGITLFDGSKLIRGTPQSRNIIDVTGAGDIVCCILAYFISRGAPIEDVVKLATQIATKSTEYPGTYTLTRSDILLSELAESKVITFEQLKYLKDCHPASNIAFTNGCFDILHSGHIKLFKFCKERGDVVVVGLNSDSSVRNLKGPSRPFNNIHTRMDVLNSIGYIDYIITFDSETPYDIIKELSPDVLIKGGDYKPEDIIGRQFAKETVVCDMLDGYSSTNIIRKLI